MQQYAQAVEEERSAWGAVVSVVLHGCVIGAIALLPMAPRSLVPELQTVDVELIPPQPAAKPNPVASALPSPPAPLPQTPPATLPGVSDTSAMTRATAMLSEKTLADPRSREARQILRQLGHDERAVQLCSIEAMDQIHHWQGKFRPDRLVAYAKAEASISGNAVEAEGAAFRSNGRWYNLKFRCQLAGDAAKVAAFEFMVGEPVPVEEWEAYSLPALH